MLLGGFITYHICRTYDSFRVERKEIPQVPLSVFLFKLLPLKLSSGMIFSISHTELPIWSRTCLISLYSKFTGVNLSEIDDEKLVNYSSFNKFFSRKLADNARKLDKSADLVCPCDGTILETGKFESFDDKASQIISKVKGFQFSVDQLLYGIETEDSGNSRRSILKPSSSENSLYYCVMYLAPGDYHRFHSPIPSWKVHTVNHIHGELLPVAPKILPLLKTVFTLNERCSIIGTWKHGHFNMIPIGSTNVGSIKLNDFVTSRNLETKYDEAENSRKSIKITNVNSFESGLSYLKDLIQSQRRKNIQELSTVCVHKPPFPSVVYNMGEEVGYFELGSTVILIFEAPNYFRFSVSDGQKIQMGNELGKLE